MFDKDQKTIVKLEFCGKQRMKKWVDIERCWIIGM